MNNIFGNIESPAMRKVIEQCFLITMENYFSEGEEKTKEMIREANLDLSGCPNLQKWMNS